MKFLIWILRIVAAVILVQTLYFKFSAAPESVYIFSQIGMEPVGRIGIGIMELIAAILLLTPKISWAGAVLSVGLMAGAIFFHLGKLGINVQNDGGKLFILALVVMVCGLILSWLERKNIPIVKKFFLKP